MNVTTHERPGVYSVYGASSLVRGSGGRKTVGLAAVNTKAEAGVIQTITSYEEAVSTFGSQADSQDMAELIRVILLNGAAAVAVVPVANAEGYEAAFAAMSGMEDLSVVVCDSTDQEVQQKLRDSVTAASAARRERIAVNGWCWPRPAGYQKRGRPCPVSPPRRRWREPSRDREIRRSPWAARSCWG